jgi:hypothetical protein
MSNSNEVGGWQTLLTNFVYKTLSAITPLTRFPNVSFCTVRAFALAHLVADGLANFGMGEYDFGRIWRTLLVMTQGKFMC